MKFRTPIALALALAACSPSPETLYERAQKSFAAHQYTAAQLDLANALEADPNNAAYIELRARIALAQGDGSAAKAALAKLPDDKRPADYGELMGEAELLSEQPAAAVAAVQGLNSAEAFRIRALAALVQEDNAAAEAAFLSGQSGSGPKARLLADFARLRLHQSNLAEANRLSQAALAADAKSLDAQLVTAQVKLARGDLAGALAGFEAVEKAYPGNLPAITGKAAVLGDLGRTAEMEDVLKAASESAARDPSVAYLQARLAAAKGDWKSARQILQANEGTLSGREDAALLYAHTLSELGQGEQAQAQLATILATHPENLAVRRSLGQIQLKAGDARGATATLKPIAANPVADAADLRLLATASAKAGDPDAAALAQRAKFPSPQSLMRSVAEADKAMQSANWGNAIALYQSILSVTDGRNPVVLNNMAYAQSQVGNKKAALEFALRALKEAPQNPSVMDTAGMLLAETGTEKRRALELVSQAARLAPGNANIQAHLRQLQGR